MIAIAVTLAALAAAPDAGAPAGTALPEVQGTMRNGLLALVRLQPFVASPPAFRDPKNLKDIKRDLDALGQIEHRVSEAKVVGPGTIGLAHLFGAQVQATRRDVNGGNWEAARVRLRSLTMTCLGCHQRGLVEKDFDDAGKMVDSLGLPPLARAEFYAATRQFDRALKTWTEALAKPPRNDAEAIEHARAIRLALAITVRAKDDAGAAVKLLEAQKDRKDLPGFVRVYVGRWLDEARAWQKENVRAASLAPEGALEKAKGLLESAGATREVYADEGRLVSFLRAAAYLNEALGKQPDAKWRGEALFLLGVASAAVADPLLWELDAMYLEACVRENPHTEIALRCMNRLTDRMTVAYTTSSGVEFPPDVVQRLAELRGLTGARVKPGR